MSENCEVCKSPQRGVVASMIECGAETAEIASTLGFDVSALDLHMNSCCMLPDSSAVLDPMAQSDQRLRVWLHRSNELYLTSGLQGDVRGQVAALREGVKAELEFRRRTEARNTRNAEMEANEQLPWGERVVTIKMLDQIIAETQKGK
jgi:hypothetical protein